MTFPRVLAGDWGALPARVGCGLAGSEPAGGARNRCGCSPDRPVAGGGCAAHRRIAQWVQADAFGRLHRLPLDVLGATGQIDWSRPESGRPGASPETKTDALTERGGIPLVVLISATNRDDHLLFDELVVAVPPVRRPRRRPGEAPRG